MSDAPKQGWAGELGDTWLANLDGFEGMIASVGDALSARAGFAPGERVIDLGCGAGRTTIDIARAVAPGGSVLGLDISQPLVAAATRRAAAAGVRNIAFTCVDAAVARPSQAPFDRLYSRFGSMFFDDPTAAFANLHAMLRQGGRIDLAVWAPVDQNGWISTLLGVLARHVPLPRPAPDAPGSFSLGDTDRLREILAGAGFRDVTLVAWESLLPIGGVGAEPEAAADFAVQSMPFSQALRAAGPELAGRIQASIATELAAHHVPGEGVLLPGKVWLVTATA